MARSADLGGHLAHYQLLEDRKAAAKSRFVTLHAYDRAKRAKNLCRATVSEGNGDNPVDIDQLARLLSREADKLRRAEADAGNTFTTDAFVEGVAENMQSVSENVLQGAQARAADTEGPFGYEVPKAVTHKTASDLT